VFYISLCDIFFSFFCVVVCCLVVQWVVFLCWVMVFCCFVMVFLCIFVRRSYNNVY
jgi:hypothetical protein